MITFTKDTDSGKSVATIERDNGPANAQGNETYTAYRDGRTVGLNRVAASDLPSIFAHLVDEGYRLGTETAPSN
jgi:hypothetical protein